MKDTWPTIWGLVAAAGQAARLAPLGKWAWISDVITALGIAALGKQAAGIDRRR